MKLDPDFEDAYFLRGRIYLIKYKDYSKAVADFDKYIELDPFYSYSYYYRGIAKYNLEDYANACKDFELAEYYGGEELKEDSYLSLYMFFANCE